MGLFDRFLPEEDPNQPFAFDPSMLGAPGAPQIEPPRPGGMMGPLVGGEFGASAPAMGGGMMGPDLGGAPRPPPAMPPPGPPPEQPTAFQFQAPQGGFDPAAGMGALGGLTPPTAVPQPKKLNFLDRLGRAVQSDDWGDFAAGLKELGGQQGAMADRRAQLQFEQQRRITEEAKARMAKQAKAAAAASKGGKWDQSKFDEVMGDEAYDPQDVAAMRGMHQPRTQIIKDVDGNEYQIDLDTLKKTPLLKGRGKPVKITRKDGTSFWATPPALNQSDDIQPQPADLPGPGPKPMPPAQAPIPPVEAPAPEPVAAMTPSSHTPADREAMIDMVATEAANQGDQGMAAVAHVGMNRLKTGYKGAKNLHDVVYAPHQFEGLKNRAFVSKGDRANAARVVDAVLAGQMPDPTGGAINYINKDMQLKRGMKIPGWASGQGQQIGAHTFFGGQQQQVAGGAGQNTLAGGAGDDTLDEEDDTTPAWGGDEAEAVDNAPEEADEDMTGGAGSDALTGGIESDELPPGYSYVGEAGAARKPTATFRPPTDDEMRAVHLDPKSTGFQVNEQTHQIGRIPGLPKAEAPEKTQAREQEVQRGVMAAQGLFETAGKAKGLIGTGIDLAGVGKPGYEIPFSGETGLVGQAMSHIGTTRAATLKSYIKQLQGPIAFERLQQMRDSSPTGGALGQVSEKEIDLLSRAIAALDQENLSGPELRDNLQAVQNHYQNWLDNQRRAGIDVDGILKSNTRPETAAGIQTQRQQAAAPPKGSVVIGGKRYSPDIPYMVGGKRVKLRADGKWEDA